MLLHVFIYTAGAVERRGFVPPGGSRVYCSFYFYGSPAEKYASAHPRQPQPLISAPAALTASLGSFCSEDVSAHANRSCRWRVCESRYGLRPRRWLIAVNAKPTLDLDAVLEVAKGLSEGQPLRLTMMDLQGRTHAETLKLDIRYWPTTELRQLPSSAPREVGLSSGQWEVRECE
jgi:hypothetical protein